MNRRNFVSAAALAFQASAAEPMQQGKQPVRASVRGRIMAISAHPADFCSRAGGTLIKQVRAGSAVKVVWLSCGETTDSEFLYKHRPGISVQEVRRLKEKEAFAAAGVIGAEGEMLGFPDNPLVMPPERIETLARVIADFRPDVLMTHWKDDCVTPGHWLTAQSVIRAAEIANGSWDIRFFEPTIGSATRSGFIPDHYIDITECFEQKMEATTKIATQPALVENYTVCNRWRGLEIDRPYAEAFVSWAARAHVQQLLTR